MIWLTGRASLLAALCLFASAATATAESTAEMVTSYKSVAEAKVVGSDVFFLQDFPSGVCWGAFGAVQRVIVQTVAPDAMPVFRVCAPAKSTRAQLITVFVEYARRNPQRLHEEFFDVAIVALRDSFPCQPR